MKKIIIGIVSIFFTLNVASADVTSEDIAKSLKKNLNHPYLYFTENEKPLILERIDMHILRCRRQHGSSGFRITVQF